MIRFLILLFLLTIEVSSLKHKIKRLKSLRFAEGSDVTSKDLPFLVVVASLVTKRTHKEVDKIGTGILITDTWVLTAAHILDVIDPEIRDKLFIWYGDFTHSPFNTTKYTEVFNIYYHPGFRANPFTNKDVFFSTNDVALVIVSKISLESYGRLSAINHASLLGLTAKYIGFSDTNRTAGDVSLKLKHGRGLLTRCGPPVPGWSQNLLCVIPPCHKERQMVKYAGSVGDPLFVDNQIVGIFSLNFFAKGSVLWPAFTPVDMYLDWINNLIKRYE